jgi:hypothetical protein
MSLEALERVLSEWSAEFRAIQASVRARAKLADSKSADFYKGAELQLGLLKNEFAKHSEALSLLREIASKHGHDSRSRATQEERLWAGVERTAHLVGQCGRHFLQSIESPSMTVPDLAELLEYLHNLPELTRGLSFGIAFGEMRVYHAGSQFPPIYYVPAWYERVIRFRPLLLHEYGHVLFKALDGESRGGSAEPFAKLASGLADACDEGCIAAPRHIDTAVDGRRRWLDGLGRELCCDAIGLRLGRGAFARAFETHFRAEWGNAHGAEAECRDDKHPPIHLRMRILELLDVSWGIGVNPCFVAERRGRRGSAARSVPTAPTASASWWQGETPEWQKRCRDAILEVVSLAMRGVGDAKLLQTALALDKLSSARRPAVAAPSFTTAKLREIALGELRSTLTAGAAS